MEGDLVVKGTVLDQTVTSMRGLRSEFDGLDQGSALSEDGWGSHDVAGAVRTFAEDWDDRRATLSKAMLDVEQMASDCACEFTRVDDQLGQAVR